MKAYILNIEGMKCSNCASNVENALKKLRGIKSVKASQPDNKAELICEDNVKIDDISITIESLGYSLKGFEEHKVVKKLFSYKII